MNRSVLGASLLALLLATPAAAENEKSGVRPNAISLPTGPGSMAGLGESFEPDLNSGAGSYAVPIDLPTGTAGVTPQLAFVYNSGGGNGPLGIGWNLSGLSEIRRRSDRGVPRYDESDTFLFDGEPLVEVADGVYRLANEGRFLRFRRVGGGWEVDAKDGTRMAFGLVAGSRIEGPHGTYAWKLERTVHPTGQQIAYEWLGDGGQRYLAAVRYNEREGAAHREVIFDYEARSDLRRDHRPGFELPTALRLAEVEIRAEGERFGSYELRYETGTALSRLAAIRRLGTDGVTALPEVAFGYTDLDPTQAKVRSIGDAPAVGFEGWEVTVTDLDGDSLPDLLATESGNHRWWRNLGGRFAPEAGIAQSPSLSLANAGTTLADVDGDGRADLLAKSTASFRWFPNRGAAWGPSEDFTAAPAFQLDDANVRLFDYDGDGLADALQSTAAGWYFWRNRGDGSWEGPLVHEAPAQDLDLADPDTRLADFDGDGLVDVGRLVDGAVLYWPYLGWGSFGPSVRLDGGPEVVGDAGLEIADVDGDGLSDLLEIGAGSLRAWLQRHDGFSAAVVIDGTPTRAPGVTSVQLLDVNGDGGVDVVYSTPGATDPRDRLLYVDLGGGTRPNLLASVDNGLGRIVAIAYVGSGELAAADRAAGNPWRTHAPNPVQVVQAITESDSLGWSRKTTYRYRDAFYDAREREFRGFSEVEVEIEGGPTAEGLLRQLRFDTGEVHPAGKGQLLHEVERSSAGKIYRETSHGYELVELAEGVHHARRVRTEVRHVEGEETPALVRTDFAWDDFGNRLRTESHGLVVDGDPLAGDDERVEGTDWLADTERWLFLPIATWVEDGEGNRLAATRTYYDGEAFVGLPHGSAELGLVTRVESWLGPLDDRWVASERNERDAFGNVIRTLDAADGERIVRFDEETHTRPVAEEVVLGDGSLVSGASYDPVLGVVTSFTDFDGKETRFLYDPLGRLVAIVRPGDSEELPTERYVYELDAPLSRLTVEWRRASGGEAVDTEIRFFDGLARQRGAATDAGAQGWALTGAVDYDPRGNVRRRYRGAFHAAPGDEISAGTAFDETIYDALGRVVGVLYPDGTSRLVTWAPLAASEWDEADLDPASPHAETPVHRRYDGQGRVREEWQLVDGEEVRTTRSYDALGQLRDATDAEGHVRHHLFNAQGWLVGLQDPDAGSWSFEYDAAGRRVAAHAPTGDSILTAWDAAGRPLTEDWDGDGAPEVVNRYDESEAGRGRLTSALDPAGEIRFGYDDRGRVVEQVRTVDGTPWKSTFTWDARDRLVQRRFPDGTTLRWSYDARGFLVGIDGHLEQHFDANGRLVRRITGDGVATDRTYDTRLRVGSERVLAPSGTILSDVTWRYDAVGNPTTVSDLRPDVKPSLSRAATYGYDALYRLTDARLTGGGMRWSYSASGNLLEREGEGIDAGATVSSLHYGLGAGPHALTGFGDRSLQWDEAGRLLTDGKRSFTWDPAGHLEEVRLEDGSKVRHVTGFDGSRVIRERLDASGKVLSRTVYLDDALELRDGNLIRYANAGAVRVARIEGPVSEAQAAAAAGTLGEGDLELPPGTFLFGAAALLALAAFRRTRPGFVLAAAAAAACSGDEGARLIDVPGDLVAAVRYYHTDHLGSVTLVSQDGNVVSERGYAPFGTLRGGDRGRDAYDFTGAELDGDTGLRSIGARHYDAELARWISPDPILFRDPGRNLEGIDRGNPYTYAGNRPLVAVDPSGEDAIYIAFPDYKISVSDTIFGYKFKAKLENLGHAGVLLVDNKTGRTSYYEYGRYDTAGKGIVRRVPVPDVKIGKDGMPTPESLARTLSVVSRKSGHKGRIEGAYVKNDKYKEMVDYANGEMGKNTDPKREEYKIMSKNCGTFARDVINKGGGADVPTMVDPRPTSYVEEMQGTYSDVSWKPGDKTAVAK